VNELEDQNVPVDDSEAGEAGAVATEITRGAPDLREMAALDGDTLEGLDDAERAELGEGAEEGEATRGAGPARLSRNFLLSEFHCCRGHCAAAAVPSAAVPALRRLARQVLQPLREQFGVCRVHSGYRNAAHNAHVDGASQSYHRYDVRPEAPAADLSFERGSVDEWAQAARQRLQQLGAVGGIGRYHGSGFIHVDLGPERRWTG
jgi:Peptidase M15